MSRKSKNVDEEKEKLVISINLEQLGTTQEELYLQMCFLLFIQDFGSCIQYSEIQDQLVFILLEQINSYKFSNQIWAVNLAKKERKGKPKQQKNILKQWKQPKSKRLSKCVRKKSRHEIESFNPLNLSLIHI
eukprot:TRINITY_DN609_c0_g1_i8.p2 TRINITY_DN609_c0_g1~~TRINITY_DN609_c0_g1_i8.p2  ORF type:complete len:132 (-),score=1.17 TRINITY_DN609_c0_g1_i8:72-467(-)